MGLIVQSKVSVRGQPVIPWGIREVLGITANSLPHWKIQDGIILVYPVPTEPVRASLGVLRGKGTFEEFLRERDEGRESGNRWPLSSWTH